MNPKTLMRIFILDKIIHSKERKWLDALKSKFKLKNLQVIGHISLNVLVTLSKVSKYSFVGYCHILACIQRETVLSIGSLTILKRMEAGLEPETRSELIAMRKKGLQTLGSASPPRSLGTTVQCIRKAGSKLRGQSGDGHFTGQIKAG